MSLFIREVINQNCSICIDNLIILNMFYRWKVEEIRENIDKMQDNVVEVNKLHSGILSQPQTDESNYRFVDLLNLSH